jgi:hypothetical protein
MVILLNKNLKGNNYYFIYLMNIKNPFADLSIDTDDEIERVNKPVVSNSTLPSTLGEKKRRRKVRPEEKQRIEEEKLNKAKDNQSKVVEVEKIVNANDGIEVIIKKADDYVDLQGRFI